MRTTSELAWWALHPSVAEESHLISSLRLILPVAGFIGISLRMCSLVSRGSRRRKSPARAASDFCFEAPAASVDVAVIFTAACRSFAFSSQTNAACTEPAASSFRSIAARSNHRPPTFAKPSARPQYSNDPSCLIRAKSRVRKWRTDFPSGPIFKSTKTPALRAADLYPTELTIGPARNNSPTSPGPTSCTASDDAEESVWSGDFRVSWAPGTGRKPA
mmetsp:Transcript_64146/g.134876  ORF Transcript_64146/g.134876 Transcript_64146/m.134876 type:complete len:218 (-) Transcript_64146:1258-1911(-)